MIVPQTYLTALVVTILSMICWGSWANTQKLAGKWRFELYYFDYAFGVLLAATIAAFTVGSASFIGIYNFTGFEFVDDLLKTGKRQIFFGIAGGLVFNLANMLLVAAISVAGLAVAFPVGIGIALVVGVVLNYIGNPQGNPGLLFTGTALLVAAIVVDALAYKALANAKADKEPLPPSGPGNKGGTAHQYAAKRFWKGLILSIVSGFLMGLFYPLVEMGKAGDLGLGPYSIGFVFATAVFFSTFLYSIYFMNLPVEGPPVSPADYFKGTRKQHLLGVLGGIIWCIGTLANFAAASAPERVQVGPAISYALGQGATMISALWGLLVWKEFAGGGPKVNALVVTMLCLFAAGLGLVSIAPLYVAH
jgi:glucose uptake protein